MKRLFVVMVVVLAGCATPRIPQGRLVDLGGRRLNLVCAGKGKPTVVLESGSGEGWSSWYRVQREIAGEFRVCAYDRAGFGFSDPRPDRSIAGLAGDLHALLRAAGEGPPYVLAGHSLGGVIVRRFAYAHRNDVAGLVLVDSAHEDFVRSSSPALQQQMNADRERGLARRSEQLRAFREKGVWDEQWLPAENPPQLRAQILPRTRSAAWWEARIAELALPDFHESVPPHQRRLEVPIVVIMSTKSIRPDSRSEELHSEWIRLKEMLQTELANRSADGELIKVDSGHYIHIDQPKLVADAIRRVARSYRANSGRLRYSPESSKAAFRCSPGAECTIPRSTAHR